MKVFLDDLREAPEGWTKVLWPDEAIELLMSGQVSHISLDHDLGDDNRGTGYDVLNWIEEVVAGDHDFVLPEITIHTANPPARDRMQAALDEIRVLYDTGKNIKEDTSDVIARASAENRRAMQLKHMQPKLAEYLDDLRDMLLDEYGDRIDRIVIIGSAVEQGFREGESDVDLVVMTNESKGKDRSFRDTISFEENVNEKFTGPWSKIDITDKSSKQVHLIGTNFLNCYEGHLLRGFLVYEKSKKATYEDCLLVRSEGYEVLSKEDAQRYIVEQYLYQAWRWLGGTSGTSDSAGWSVCRAACRALHAVLASKDMGFAPKNFRWNIVDLCSVAETLSPSLHVKRWVDMLPTDLAFIDFDDVPFDDGSTIRERRRLIAVGIIITRIVEKHLGVKADPHSRLTLRGLRKHEKEWMRQEDADGA